MNVQIEDSWKEKLNGEFEKPYFAALTDFVKAEYAEHTCYPPGRLIFNAFNLVTLARAHLCIVEF